MNRDNSGGTQQRTSRAGEPQFWQILVTVLLIAGAMLLVAPVFSAHQAAQRPIEPHSDQPCLGGDPFNLKEFRDIVSAETPPRGCGALRTARITPHLCHPLPGRQSRRPAGSGRIAGARQPEHGAHLHRAAARGPGPAHGAASYAVRGSRMSLRSTSAA